MQVHRQSSNQLPPQALERATAGEHRVVDTPPRERRRKHRRRRGRDGGRRSTDAAAAAEVRAGRSSSPQAHRLSPDEVLAAQLLHLHTPRQRGAADAYGRSEPG